MFLRIQLASLTRRTSRKALAAASIWIGVTLVVALLTLGMDVGDKLNREMRSVGANIRIEPAAAALPVTLAGMTVAGAPAETLPESELPRLRSSFWRNNVLGLAPRLSGSGTLDGRAVPLLGLWFRRALPEAEEPFVTGARTVYGHWTVEGAWPEDEGAPACLVGAVLARELGVRPGADLAVTGPGGSGTYRLAGVVQAGPPDDAALMLPMAEAQRLLAAAGRVSAVDVSALTTPENALAVRYRTDPKSLTPAEYERWACTPYPGAVALDLQKTLPGSVARVVRRIAEAEGTVMNRIGGLTWLLVGFAFVVTSLGVLGVITSAVMERRQEVALVQALGARKADVMWFFCIEAAAGGVLGGALGGVTGMLAGSRLVQAVFGSPAEFHPPLLVLGPVLGLLVSWLGGLWPVWRVVGQDTAQVLHGN